MILHSIQIENFRNFSQNSFEFNPSITILIGNNSVGKTNLLEAVYFMMKGTGFREDKEEELMRQKMNKADIHLHINDKKESKTLRIHMNRGDFLTKTFFINRVKKPITIYKSESLPVVIFSPSFMYIIDGDMQDRRDFFDKMITEIDREYKRKLVNYENSLKKRNKILEITRNKETLKEELIFWDEYLINQALYITTKRQELIDFLNTHPKLEDKTFTIKYGKNEISKKTLEDTFEKQYFIHKTLVGPQRDTFEILINDKMNVHHFGSRSEQRLSLFWLILNQIKLYEQKLSKRPLVLLDDIFSELDIENRTLVLHLIKNYQTVITTTEEKVLDLIDMPKTVINL